MVPYPKDGILQQIDSLFIHSTLEFAKEIQNEPMWQYKTSVIIELPQL
jgi:hypothetical protein